MRKVCEARRISFPNPGVVRSNRIGGTSNIRGLHVF